MHPPSQRLWSRLASSVWHGVLGAMLWAGAAARAADSFESGAIFTIHSAPVSLSTGELTQSLNATTDLSFGTLTPNILVNEAATDGDQLVTTDEPLVLPGATVPGVAGLPLLMSMTGVVLNNNAFVPPSSLNISRGFVDLSSLLSTSSLTLNAGVANLSFNGASTLRLNASSPTSGAVTLNGGLLTLSNPASTVAFAGTINTSSPVTTIGSGSLVISGSAGTLIPNNPNALIGELVQSSLFLSHPSTLVLGTVSNLALNIPVTIDESDPGTAFSDTNTVDSIVSSPTGALFPDGTEVHVLGLAANGSVIIIRNQSGHALIIAPSATTPGGLLFSSP